MRRTLWPRQIAGRRQQRGLCSARVRTVALVIIVLGGVGVTARPGTAQNVRPAILDTVGFDQHIGRALPLNLPFRDASGAAVQLGDYFGDKPVLLVPAYYECPMLCGLVLNGVVSTLRTLAFDAGREFTVVTFSISPSETPQQAAAKKTEFLSKYRRQGSETGWHFLTGSAAAIRQLTDAIGFRYERDDATGQYAHASGIVVATPDGRLSRYFYGVEYPPRDLRLALVEASDNRLGSPVDQLLLFCFQYDPTTGRYSRPAMRAMRLGGAVTVLGLGAFVMLMLRRERPGKQAQGM
jgi:protein SCO1/2